MKLKNELFNVIISLIISFFSLLIISVWRIFDTKTFLFTQIVTISSVVLFFSYGLANLKTKSWTFFIRGNEMLAGLMVFVVLSSSLINVDRSRSIFVLKWISSSQELGISESELALKHQESGIGTTAISQRVREQIQIGTVAIESNKLHLTLRGRVILRISFILSDLANLKGFKDA